MLYMNVLTHHRNPGHEMTIVTPHNDITNDIVTHVIPQVLDMTSCSHIAHKVIYAFVIINWPVAVDIFSSMQGFPKLFFISIKNAELYFV